MECPGNTCYDATEENCVQCKATRTYTFVLNIVELINHSHGHGRATYRSDSICFVVQLFSRSTC